MSIVLADTHAVVWMTHDPGRLSPAAFAALAASANAGTVYISAMSLVEVSYLTGKKSFAYTGVLRRLIDLGNDPAEPLEILPVTPDVVLSTELVSRTEIPEMPDRIIAATAVAHRPPLVSKDSKIRGSASLTALIPVIW